MMMMIDDDDDENKPFLPISWAVGVLSRVRDAYVETTCIVVDARLCVGLSSVFC